MLSLAATGVRARIHSLVQDSPGLHFRELQRLSGLATGLLQYHLAVLEKCGLIKSERVGNHRHFYPPALPSAERRILGLLRQKSVRAILIHLMTYEDSGIVETAKITGLSSSTVSWHLERLRSAGIIRIERDGKRTRCKVLPREEIAELLRTYRDSFLDKLVNNFIDTWEFQDSP